MKFVADGYRWSTLHIGIAKKMDLKILKIFTETNFWLICVKVKSKENQLSGSVCIALNKLWVLIKSLHLFKLFRLISVYLGKKPADSNRMFDNSPDISDLINICVNSPLKVITQISVIRMHLNTYWHP
jgi:hypothetical protein